MNKIQDSVGMTPIIRAKKLAKFLHIKNVFLKDETVNPSGSFKDRAISYQINHWVSLGKLHFTISSSGNAALSALYWTSLLKDTTLDIFISPRLAAYKKSKLLSSIQDTSRVTVHVSELARKDAINFSKDNDMINLTASKDEFAVIGYQTLGEEIAEYFKKKPLDAVFMPASSGVGALGMMKGYNFKFPTYIVQTTRSFEIAKNFTSNFTPTKTSLASAILANVIPQKKEIIEGIKRTNGGAFIISDRQLKDALEIMSNTQHIGVSYDSLLTIAALNQAKNEGYSIQNALCILTGS